MTSASARHPHTKCAIVMPASPDTPQAYSNASAHSTMATLCMDKPYTSGHTSHTVIMSTLCMGTTQPDTAIQFNAYRKSGFTPRYPEYPICPGHPGHLGYPGYASDGVYTNILDTQDFFSLIGCFRAGFCNKHILAG